jgi:membrane-bound lytic murein transglycosylase D
MIITGSNTKIKAIILITGIIISLSAYSNYQPPVVLNIKDSSGIDTSLKTNTSASSIKVDSSKVFKSLLSPAIVNNALNYPMNAEAKFFADDYIKKHTAYYNNMKVWAKPYFDLYDRILTSYGIPVQLKYLSVIESSLSSTAVSWAGAVGPWQIMDDAAREHGLRTSYRADDRQDYIKSTNAACKILKELYSTYGDWLLVIAAYNAGSGEVNKAIAKAHSKNFWDIQYYLPLETRNHVKKFIATHYFFEGDGSVATLTGDQTNGDPNSNISKDDYLQLASGCITINLFGKYNSTVIANNVMMDVSIFNKLNPGFDDVLAKGDIYPMRLPSDKADLFQSNKTDILRQSVELFLNNSPGSSSSQSK